MAVYYDVRVCAARESRTSGPAGRDGRWSQMRRRMSAIDRKAVLLRAAVAAFSEGSYRGTTMADVARAADVNPALLYQHFPSKAELYVAALDHAWEVARAAWDDAVAFEPDPALWLRAAGQHFIAGGEGSAQIAQLWFQALAESTSEPALGDGLAKQLLQVHAWVRDVMVRSQATGRGMRTELDPHAEAWRFISTGMLVAASSRAHQVAHDAIPGILAARAAWLYGELPEQP